MAEMHIIMSQYGDGTTYRAAGVQPEDQARHIVLGRFGFLHLLGSPNPYERGIDWLFAYDAAREWEPGDFRKEADRSRNRRTLQSRRGNRAYY